MFAWIKYALLKKHSVFVSALGIFLSVFQAWLGAQPQYQKIWGYTQGTTYHITYCNTVVRNLIHEVEQRLQEIDRVFSVYNTSSLVSRINSSDVPVQVSP